MSSTYTFTTECFFLTHECIHLGYLVVIQRFQKLARDVYELRNKLTELEERAGSGAMHNPEILGLTRTLDIMLAQECAWQVHLRDPIALQDLIALSQWTSRWLVYKVKQQERPVIQNSFGAVNIGAQFGLGPTPTNVITSAVPGATRSPAPASTPNNTSDGSSPTPLVAVVGSTAAAAASAAAIVHDSSISHLSSYIPEYILENVTSYLEFASRYHEYEFSQLPTLTHDAFFQMMLTFMANSFKNKTTQTTHNTQTYLSNYISKSCTTPLVC